MLTADPNSQSYLLSSISCNNGYLQSNVPEDDSYLSFHREELRTPLVVTAHRAKQSNQLSYRNYYSYPYRGFLYMYI